MNETDTQAAIDAGKQAVTAAARITTINHPRDPKIAVPVSIDAAGNAVVLRPALDLLDELHAARPRIGTTKLTELDSFITFVQRWGTESTVIYADTDELELVAVMDDHPAQLAGNRMHRASYACPRSPAWIAWTAIDGIEQSQSQFATLIETRLEDMVGAPGMPAPTEVLQMARSLRIHTKGEFSRDISAHNGDYSLIAKRDTDVERSTPIHRAFMLGVQVFDGGELYRVEVRVQFALEGNRPTFTLAMHRRAETERDAFGEVRVKVTVDTGRLVLAGTP